MDTAKRSVGSSHGVPPIANAMETPLSALVVLPSMSLMRVFIPPSCALIALMSVKDASPKARRRVGGEMATRVGRDDFQWSALCRLARARRDARRHVGVARGAERHLVGRGGIG